VLSEAFVSFGIITYLCYAILFIAINRQEEIMFTQINTMRQKVFTGYNTTINKTSDMENLFKRHDAKPSIPSMISATLCVLASYS